MIKGQYSSFWGNPTSELRDNSSFWGNPTSELRDITCHMGSHRETEGWVYLVHLIVHWLGVELATFRSQVWRRTTAPTRQLDVCNEHEMLQKYQRINEWIWSLLTIIHKLNAKPRPSTDYWRMRFSNNHIISSGFAMAPPSVAQRRRTK